jgi:hypothetical protein
LCLLKRNNLAVIGAIVILGGVFISGILVGRRNRDKIEKLVNKAEAIGEAIQK